MFDVTVPIWETVFRVVIIYAGLFILLRILGKRELGQLTPMDLVTIFLLSETVSPALTGDDTSIPTGFVAAGALLLTSFGIALATHRFPRFERQLEGEPVVVVRDGVTMDDALASERITEQDLHTALRKQGVQSPSDVKLAVLEPDGQISVVKKD